MVGQYADAETLSQIRARLGVDQNPVSQYGHYLMSVLQGDWGISSRYREPVWPLILERFPKTLQLALSAMLFAVLVGVTAGMTAAIYRDRRPDQLISFFSLAGISAPVFWIGILLVWLFSLQLGWLPPSGYEEGAVVYLVLPALTLGLRSIALITRITRAAFIDVASSAYLRTARAKGVSPFALYGKHALRNTALPILTVVGLDLGSYLSGSVLTEKVFAWPGLGRLMVDAIVARDTALINACVVFMATVYVLVNLIVDLCYGLFDPRVREGQS